MYRLALIAIAVCAIAISTVPLTTRAAPPPPSNISSHLPEFFRDLLTDRVYVYERREAPAAMYFAKDGTYYACWLHSDGRYVRVHDDATWTIGTSARTFQLSWAHIPSPHRRKHHHAEPHLHPRHRPLSFRDHLLQKPFQD